ncbi:MAG: acetylornithine deacetylase [Geminicoccales bacterium]
MSNTLSCQDILARLIAFDTTSRHSNLDLIDFVRVMLDDLGIGSELIANEEGTKANLFASIGPIEQPGLVLSGHTDVVPVDGQDWSTNPFALTERDDCLFGRGTSDMKGFIAAVLALLPEINAMRLERPIHLAFSYDEEVGCKGVPSLLDRLVEHLPVLPRGCVVGEPTGMKVANGHKGKAGYRCIVTGRASHSALNHLGVNAVEMAALIVARLREMNVDFRARGPFIEGFDPPYCTVTTGVMAGGTALNIVPSSCRFEFEFRLLPGQEAKRLLADIQNFANITLLPAMRAVADEAAIEWQELMSYPALGRDHPSEIEQLSCALTSTEQPLKLAFGTEAGHFAKRGIPSIVCGPGYIDVAHKPDEHVEIKQLNECTTFLRAMVHEAAVA